MSNDTCCDDGSLYEGVLQMRDEVKSIKFGIRRPKEERGEVLEKPKKPEYPFIKKECIKVRDGESLQDVLQRVKTLCDQGLQDYRWNGTAFTSVWQEPEEDHAERLKQYKHDLLEWKKLQYPERWEGFLSRYYHYFCAAPTEDIGAGPRRTIASGAEMLDNLQKKQEALALSYADSGIEARTQDAETRLQSLMSERDARKQEHKGVQDAIDSCREALDRHRKELQFWTGNE